MSNLETNTTTKTEIDEYTTSTTTIVQSSPDEIYLSNKIAKRLVIKNVLVVGFSWIFLFTAYSSIANLQSSLNSDGGLGTASLSTIYVALIVSSLFVPTTMIKKLGIKKTIFFSQLGYILYILSNIYPRYFTMIPSAIIIGLAAAPLWTAKCTFLSDLGTHYSKYSGDTSEAIINRFFGIFFAMFQSSNIWGNIISSTVLKPVVEENVTLIFNITNCGINDCPGTDGIELKKPEISTVYLLCGIYVVTALLGAILIICLVDSYEKIGLSNKNTDKKSSISLLMNTLKHMKNKNQLLIIPLTLFSGFEQAYLGADFTKSFITCTKGIENVGVIMICYGLADTLGSYGFGYIIKYTGRIPVFVLASAINYICIIIMILWNPNNESALVLYIVAILWGLGDSIWQTQINSFYGVIFERDQHEAAFSNYRLWESLGFAIAYAYSNALCVRIKIYLLLIYLTIGMLGYGLIEFRIKKDKTKIETF